MATLCDSLIDNHQPNETILVYGGGNDSGYATVKFHQLGRTREEIVSEYAPKLSLWLRKYLPPSIQLGDDLTDAELVARYQCYLATLHVPLLAGLEGGDERIQRFERMRKKPSCVSLVPSSSVTPSTWNETNTASRSYTLNRPSRHITMAMLPYSRRSPPDSIILHPSRISLDHARGSA